MAFKIRPFSLFKVPNVCLRTLGFWPGPENQARQTKHFAVSVLNCVFMTIVLVVQIDFTFNGSDDLSMMIESLVLSFTCSLTVIKIVVYLLKRNELEELLDTFDSLVTNGELTFWSQNIDKVFSFLQK
jgi:hypothetical protein